MDALLTLGGLTVMVVGAELMVRGAVDLALRARISPLVVGLTVVSIGTSAPELLVSLLAALKGSSDIAIGNVVGSNIANLALVLGACSLIYPLEVDRDAWRIHWPVMMGASVLFVAAMDTGRIERWEGALGVALLSLYVGWMVRASRKATRISSPALPPGTKPVYIALPLLVVGVLGLTKGADWFVEGAAGMARTWGVSEQLIGVTVVAVGTSLPELVTSLVAAIRKQADISLGNLVGSNIFNLLGIIGVSATVLPIRVDRPAFHLDLLVMFAVALVIYPFMRLSRRVGRSAGAVLLAGYIAYIVFAVQRG
jgi:cation:H+ antiporter